MEALMSHESDLNFKATELRLGLPGTDESTAKNYKRASPESVVDGCDGLTGNSGGIDKERENAPASKSQIVGWPPVRSYWKNVVQPRKIESETGNYVKVCMDGAPYLRKVDLNIYKGYQELLKALEKMFKVTMGEYSEREGYRGSEYAPAYEDKDGDLMLVGDVPWDMFMSACKRLRIMKGSEATGLGCGA